MDLDIAFFESFIRVIAQIVDSANGIATCYIKLFPRTTPGDDAAERQIIMDEFQAGSYVGWFFQQINVPVVEPLPDSPPDSPPDSAPDSPPDSPG